MENVNLEFQKDSLDEKKFLLKLPKKDTILFITKDTDLLKSKGQLKIADVGSKFIKPSDKISFQFNGKEYQLYAIGEENKDKTIPYFDVKNPQIYFVGDLDGDEKLDLILNTSYQKEENPTIYLSKNASVGSILSVSGMKLSK